MIAKKEFPILEFDDDTNAKINPETFAGPAFGTDMLIITFFPEVLERLCEEGAIHLERTIPGENPIPIYRFADSGILIVLGIVGCPSCAGNLDLFSARGIKKVMFCGGGGVLDKRIAVGHIIVVEGAIRDEGFSYHYVAPSRYIYSEKSVLETITGYLESKSIPHMRAMTWTTDAIFRETNDRIALRKAEGALVVEMEQAGCIAVAQCRGLKYGALIYGGDDVSQGEWSQRGWRSRKGVRYDLVTLCKKLVTLI